MDQEQNATAGKARDGAHGAGASEGSVGAAPRPAPADTADGTGTRSSDPTSDGSVVTSPVSRDVATADGSEVSDAAVMAPPDTGESPSTPGSMGREMSAGMPATDAGDQIDALPRTPGEGRVGRVID